MSDREEEAKPEEEIVDDVQVESTEEDDDIFVSDDDMDEKLNVDKIGEKISLTIPKLKNMEKGLVSPH